VWHTTTLSKTSPDSSLLTQYADPSNGAVQCSQIQPIYISLSRLCREIPESSVSATEQAQWIVEFGLQMVRAQARIFFCSSKKVSLSLEAIISRSMSSISFINPIELRISDVSDIFSDGCLASGTGITREKNVVVSGAMGSLSLTER